MNHLRLIAGASVLLVIGIVSILQFAEFIYYLVGIEWYYRFGPAFHRSEWKSRISPTESYAAIERQARQLSLRVFAWGDTIGLRRKWWQLGAYPRATIQFREEADGGTLIFEVRPWIGMALFALAMPVLLVIPRLRHITTYSIILAVAAIVLCIYVGYWRREVRILSRAILGLNGLGITLCPTCGYDLFGHEDGDRCPECGNTWDCPQRNEAHFSVN